MACLVVGRIDIYLITAEELVPSMTMKVTYAGAELHEDISKLLQNIDNTTQTLDELTNRALSVAGGRAMAQAVSRRPLTAEARVRSRDRSMWDLWWKK
jgi:hypothetical protein